MDKCRSCEAPIIWVKTVNGKSMPLDAEPVQFGGNIKLNDDGTCEVMPTEEAKKYPGKRYKSHFATCKNATSHRKAK